MFKELAALAQHSPLLLLISREGEKLRVNLTRKEDKDEVIPALSLSILATAEELDAELPLALAEGLAMSDAPAATPTVAEQVKGQIEAGKEGEDTGKTAAAPKTKAKRARRVRPAKKQPKTAKPAPIKKRTRKAALPEVKPVVTAEHPQKRRRRKTAATNTPEGGPSAGATPASTSAPSPGNGTGEGAAIAAPARIGEALPPGVERTPAPAGAPITGDGSGAALPPIPATASDPKTLDLFS